MFTYGDEIGLQANQMSSKANQTREAPKMVWNVEKEETDGAKVSGCVQSVTDQAFVCFKCSKAFS